MPKIWIAHDVGKCINPVLVMGQVEGSVYMGLGEAMMEEMAYRTDANANVVHKFPSMLEYKSPTTKEMPEVETFLVEDPDANGPFGAKEVGQGPLLPIPPGRRQRGLRRGRRAHRRGSRDAGKGPACAEGEGAGEAGALRPRTLSRTCRTPRRSTSRPRRREATAAPSTRR